MDSQKILVVLVAAMVIATSSISILLTSQQSVVLRIATTTSLNDTELLDALKERFEKENPGINVTWVAVGTGQAVEIGKRGDVDAIIVHDRALENEFIDQRYGVHGITIAWNDYVIVGPHDDPANVTLTKSAVEAFKKIYDAGALGEALFISRGDRSGTELRELDIWKKTKVDPKQKSWYIETGQGMASTLRIANEKEAYTLTDRATYIMMENEDGFDIKLLFENDTSNLLNLYRAIIVNPERFSNMHYAEAEKFILFIISNEGQELIGSYTKNGQKLFNSIFGKLRELGIDDPYEEDEVIYWKSKLQG